MFYSVHDCKNIIISGWINKLNFNSLNLKFHIERKNKWILNQSTSPISPCLLLHFSRGTSQLLQSTLEKDPLSHSPLTSYLTWRQSWKRKISSWKNSWGLKKLRSQKCRLSSSKRWTCSKCNWVKQRKERKTRRRWLRKWFQCLEMIDRTLLKK